MAVQPPPAQVSPAFAAPPPAQKRGGCAGCGFSCLGCAGVLVLIVLLLLGGGYYFFVAQAEAAVPAPATLVVINPTVDVGRNDSGYRTAMPGESLTAGSSVRTGKAGHAAIQYPDGSFVRMAPDTVVTVNATQLSRNGALQSASLLQKIGRTLTDVQHLIGGATFQVKGHAVSAQVRGTEFEVLVRKDLTNLIKVFDGAVMVSGTTTVTVTANQEIDADANGRLSNLRTTTPDPQDPFAVAANCANAASGGNSAGTMQTSIGDNVATGQTSAEQDYDSPGGNLTIAFCYPGSLMSVTVTDPGGRPHSAQGKPPVILKILNGPPGRYRAVVKGINVPPAGEPYALTFATDAACVGGNIDTGGVVRQTLSNSQIAGSLSQAGASGITLQIQGTSPTSARIYYSSAVGGIPISWTIDFYAATPNLGVVLTQLIVRGINITTQVVSRLPQSAGQSGISTDFVVDRVYSCNGPGGDMMVIEGHR